MHTAVDYVQSFTLTDIGRSRRSETTMPLLPADMLISSDTYNTYRANIILTKTKEMWEEIAIKAHLLLIVFHYVTKGMTKKHGIKEE